MRKTAGVLVTTALVAVMLSGIGAQAHLGLGGTIGYLGKSGYLQAESFSSLPSGCDPGADGDHTVVSPRDVTDAAGVSGARIPYTHCMIGWWDMHLSHAVKFTKYRIRVDQPAGLAPTDNIDVTIKVWHDDSWTNINLASMGTATLSAADGWREFAFTTANLLSVTYYYQTIKIQAIPGPSAPAGTNVWVDWVYYEGQCLNAAPLLDALNVDGLVNGLIGWAGVDDLTGDPFLYSLDLLNVRDPNGDPFEIVVTWADGLQQTITSDEYASGVTDLVRSFDLTDPTALVPQVISFVVTITDDPTLRCLTDTVNALYKSLPLDFVVIPDLLADLLSPIAGVSCHDGVLKTTWTVSGLDTIYGNCPAAMTVASAGLPPGSILGSLHAGASVVESAYGTDLTFQFDATSIPEGFQTLEGCYSVVGDKYGREFCSDPYYFENRHCINTPPTVTGITGDGMLNGLNVWLGLPYTLEAQVLDAEGDNVNVEWIWQDQPSDFGATATRAFFTPGGHPFTLRLTEDLSGRCPDAPTEDVLVHGNMVVAVDDWLPTLQFPRAGMSCIGQRYIPTPLFEQDVMASSCDISGLVDTTAGMSSIAKGSFLLDGQTIWQGTSSAIKTTYNSLQYTTSEKSLSACFQADGDKYGRLFCSSEFTFLNVGR